MEFQGTGTAVSASVCGREKLRPHNEPVDKDVTFRAHFMLPQQRRIPTKAVLLKLIYSGSFIVDPRCVFTFSPSAHIDVKLNFPPARTSPGIFQRERISNYVRLFSRRFLSSWVLLMLTQISYSRRSFRGRLRNLDARWDETELMSPLEFSLENLVV